MSKILLSTSFYPPFGIGGACTSAYYLANELAKIGNEVHVLYSLDAYRLKRGKSRQHSDYENYGNVIVHQLRSDFGIISPLVSYIIGTPRLVPQLRNIIEHGDFDIIHHHNISLLGPKILSYGKCTKFYTAHDFWLICPQNTLTCQGGVPCNHRSALVCSMCLASSFKPPQLWRHTPVLSSSLKQINKIITPSKYMESIMREHFPELDIIHIPNFVPPPPRDIPDPQFSNYYLYVGQLEPHKGILNLLEVFSKVPANLIVVGVGSLERRVRAIIQEKDLSNRIKFLGRVSRRTLYSLYKGAHAALIPSLWPENHPIVALEAISSGTPVIAASTGGVPEIVRLLDSGLLFETFTQLEEIIRTFDKSRYKETEIKRAYEKNFSPKSYLNRYLDLIG